MWILTLIVLNITCYPSDCISSNRISSNQSSPSVATVEYTSKEKCIVAANIANKRLKVSDAWCTPK